MNPAEKENPKFWAGGLREFHRSHPQKKVINSKRTTRKGIIGWWQRFFLRNSSNHPFGPGSKDIDERLFTTKSMKRND